MFYQTSDVFYVVTILLRCALCRLEDETALLMLDSLQNCIYFSVGRTYE